MYLQNNKDARVILHFPFLNGINDFSVVGICNGLVCLRMYNPDSLILCNPATQQFRKFPDYKWWDDSVTRIAWLTFRFGFHPNAGDYVLIRIVYYYLKANRSSKLLVRIDMYMMGTDTWRELDVTMPSCFDEDVIDAYFSPCEVYDTSCAVFVNGVLYWETRNSSLTSLIFVSLDLDNEVIRKIRVPNGFNEIFWQLVELKGNLALTNYIINFRCFDVWVLNEDQKSWTNQFRVGPFADPMGCWKFDSIRVKGCAKNGEIVLRANTSCGCRKLYLYNPKSQEIKNLPFQQNLPSYIMYMYVETLHPVKTDNES